MIQTYDLFQVRDANKLLKWSVISWFKDKIMSSEWLECHADLIPKLAMLTLRVHYEPLNSNWSQECECIVEFLFFSYNRLCTVNFRIREEIGWCRTKGESEEFIMRRQQYMRTSGNGPIFQAHGRCRQSPKQSFQWLYKNINVLQIFLKKYCLYFDTQFVAV